MTHAKARRLVARGCTNVGRLEGLGAVRLGPHFSDTDQLRIRAQHLGLYLPRCEMGRAGASQGSVAGSAGHLAAEQPWWGQRGRRSEAGSRRRPLRGVHSALGRTRLFAAAFHRCWSPGVPKSDLAAPRVTTARCGWAERSADPTGELGGCGCSSMEWGLPGGHSPMGTAQPVLRLSRGFGLLT